MNANDEAVLLRIHISNTDKFRHNPLSDMLVYTAKRYGLSGATVLRGVMGYGSSNVVHSTRFWEVTEKIPLVIEIIDLPLNIDRYLGIILPWFDKIPTGCLITSEKVNVILSKKGRPRSFFKS
ncbi:MAG TPA: DUF190 domain-containing protein [Lentimicrobium sp.]|nr:DUF190 domain-containing protein [Lentimicrobium sp.]